MYIRLESHLKYICNYIYLFIYYCSICQKIIYAFEAKRWCFVRLSFRKIGTYTWKWITSLTILLTLLHYSTHYIHDIVCDFKGLFIVAELVTLLEQLLLTETDYIQLDRFPDHSYYNMVSLSGEKLWWLSDRNRQPVMNTSTAALSNLLITATYITGRFTAKA